LCELAFKVLVRSRHVFRRFKLAKKKLVFYGNIRTGFWFNIRTRIYLWALAGMPPCRIASAIGSTSSVVVS
jgi:hypothetical protein